MVQNNSHVLPKITRAIKLANDYTHKKHDSVGSLHPDGNQKPYFKLKKFLRVGHRIDDLNQKYIESRNHTPKRVVPYLNTPKKIKVVQSPQAQ
mmetsp:Transcript_31197/g.28380  ORF Transcript_31197/g.28380 Transcript_31197/m.28380 type:complete len:93 (-) Transcript_31197:264-542(-)